MPTPVQKLERLGAEIGVTRLYIKRDDLTGRIYGGNKVRKLEFLLGDALRAGARAVMTSGFAGSNHALATAIYARQVGLRSISLLMPQKNANYVRRNLLRSYASGAELHHYPNSRTLKVGALHQLLRHRLRGGGLTRIIPAGGSSCLGTLGFVNAALELKAQIERGLIPEPDFIYTALGTAGTAVGLVIGLKAAGLNTRVVPVRVVDFSFVGEERMAELLAETAVFLNSLDPTFSAFEPYDRYTDVVCGFLGEGYANFTEAGMAAVRLMEKSESIRLDGTYTGKTLAALVKDAEEDRLRDKVVLFWNTLNSKDLSPVIDSIDYRLLPRSFHRYFEKDVQPLDTE